MKKIAILEAEYESEDLISDKDLLEMFNNNWLEFLKFMLEEEGIGIFDEIKVVGVKDSEKE